MKTMWRGLIFGLALVACTAKRPGTTANSSHFQVARKLGVVTERVEEASGLVASSANPGFLWTLNDSGNPAEIFLLDTLAQVRMTCRLAGATNRDWEDIALGDGPEPGKKYLYVADIGDNFGIHSFKYLYRIEEPTLANGPIQANIPSDRLVVVLPDGKRDAETLMIDPVRRDLYIVSKRESRVHLYQAGFPYPSDTIRPNLVATLNLTEIVAGAISPDGEEVLLKNYKHLYYWRRHGEKNLVDVMSQEPLELTYTPELQGEAICWNTHGSGFYTLSESPERRMAYLWYYGRK